jgi:carbohydrate-selective porin OprB
MMLRSLVAAAAVWLASDLAGAQAENLPRQGESTIPSAWDALRRDAAARGVGLSAVYDGEGLVNATGGIRTGAVYVGTLHLQLTVDGERLLGWRGVTFFLDGLGTHGGHPTAGGQQEASLRQSSPRPPRSRDRRRHAVRLRPARRDSP